MGCGLEHLSNCHGERELIAGVFVFLTTGGLIVRTRYELVKTWCQAKWNSWRK